MREAWNSPAQLRAQRRVGKGQDALVQRVEIADFVVRVDLERGVLLEAGSVVGGDVAGFGADPEQLLHGVEGECADAHLLVLVDPVADHGVDQVELVGRQVCVWNKEQNERFSGYYLNVCLYAAGKKRKFVISYNVIVNNIFKNQRLNRLTCVPLVQAMSSQYCNRVNKKQDTETRQAFRNSISQDLLNKEVGNPFFKLTIVLSVILLQHLPVLIEMFSSDDLSIRDNAIEVVRMLLHAVPNHGCVGRRHPGQDFYFIFLRRLL